MNVRSDITVGQTTAYPTSLRSRWIPRFSTIIAWLTGPIFLRPFSAILRRWAPILSIGKFVFVSRHEDVVDGLAHDTEFTIAEINAEATNRDNGPFVLSMDRSPQHDREKELLNSVMGRADLDRIRTIAVTHATECIERARQQGWLDVVGGLTRIVPLRVIGDYFGVPGPDDAVMQRWMRTLFHDLFINPLEKPRITRRAVDSYEQLRPHLLGRIAQRREELTAGHVSGSDDVLTRMVRCQAKPGMDWLDDDCIRRNISGLIIGALDTVSAAATKVIDQLLRRPVILAEAQNAARAGDDATVSHYVFEALRFNPHNAFVQRYSHEGATLGRGTPRQRTLASGKRVVFGTLSGMFDREVFEDPGRFRIDRQVSPYLHFSSGLHACQGRYVSGLQIPIIVAAVLQLSKVRRAPGWDGRIAYDGPFPDRLILTCRS